MMSKQTKQDGPKVLLLDIETAPILARVWGLWDQTVSLSQIKSDWFILSWAAKWLDAPANETMYMDQRNAKDIEDDSRLLHGIWKLLDEADIIITQNGNQFDVKKLNARFIMQGMSPPSSYRKIDTLLLAKKHFGFTSNKLEYMTDKLCVKYKKLQHKDFPGFELWKECLARNPKAFKSMEKYNKYDVLSLEEVYHKLIVWDTSVNFNLYTNSTENVCKCGNNIFNKNGFFYTSVAKYQRYKCTNCNSETRDRTNLLSDKKKKSLRVATLR